MERTHYSFHNNTNYYNEAHENVQHASQPGIGQTSGASTSNEQVKVQFLAGFESYAQGVPLQDCSATLNFQNYATDYGKLTREGAALYSDLPPNEQQRVDQALYSRSENYHMPKASRGTQASFLVALKEYAQGASLKRCSEGAGINLKHYVTDDGYLKPGRGEVLYNSIVDSDEKAWVDQALDTRKRLSGHSTVQNHGHV
ncbi:MAG: hypothetical protein P8X74_22780 [Reinekea sp.]